MSRIGQWVRKYGVWILIAAVLATVPCGFVVSRLKLELNIVNMYPEGDPQVEGLRYFSRNFGISDVLVLVVRGEGAEHDAKVRALHGWLGSAEHFTAVDRRELPTGGTALVAFTREPAMRQAFCRKMFADVQQYLDRAGIEAKLTGPPAFVTESGLSLHEDLARTGVVAVVLIAGILLVSFGDPLLPFLALVPLGLGVLWTLAFAQQVFGQVNLLTASLPVSLLGIGIDYALHLHTGRTEFADVRSPVLWGRVFAQQGPPLLIGMLTTTAAFLALLFAQMRAVSQMGSAGSMGLPVIFLLCMLTMPVLLDGRSKVGLRMRSFPTGWASRVLRAVLKHRRLTLAVFAIVTAGLGAAALGIRISADPAAYENPNLSSRKVSAELAAETGVTDEPLLIATPDIKAERRVLAHLRDLIGPDKPFGRVDCLSETLLAASRLPEYRLFQQQVRDLLDPDGPDDALRQHWDRLRAFPQLRRYLGEDGRLCMILYPRVNPRTGGELAELIALTETIRRRSDGDVEKLSGHLVVFAHMLDLIRSDMVRTGGIAGIIVLLVLGALVRRPRFFLAAAVPLTGGVIWMLGIMRLAGQELTAASVIVMPLVVGLGIDYGVHIVHRLRTASVEVAVATTGRAIVVASLTTAGAFFALCLAENRALSHMGLAAATGILSCLVWSLVFLPALLAGAPRRA